jgi:hypothetical protein
MPIIIAEMTRQPERREGDVAALDDARVRRLLAELNVAVGEQWRAEAAVRRLNRPQPIKLRWETTHRPVAAGEETASGDLSGLATPFLALLSLPCCSLWRSCST